MKSVIEKIKCQKEVMKSCISKVTAAFTFLFISCLTYADDLSPAKALITGDVGKGTTIWWIIYLIEGFMGAMAYHKTKSIYALGGTFVLMLFTTVLFAVLPS